MWDTLWINGPLATCDADSDAPYGLVKDGAIAAKNGKIVFVGTIREISEDIGDAAIVVNDLAGALVTPGLIDCHTHLVYAGSRAEEFEARLNGATYEEIAAQGGGILSTVEETRAASEDELIQQSLPRLDALIAEGVTTVEIKSGYGLSLVAETKMLRVARRLGELRSVNVTTTFLGAHALPREFSGRADDYINHVSNEMLPAIAKAELADAVDGFCENIGFSPEQIQQVFEAAAKANLPVKLHAEQLSDLGGAALASKYDALSADHLEFLSEKDASAMAQANTVAVLLPGAYYFLRETQLPPIDFMRAAELDMAIATDCNPGTSPLTSILLAMNMGCTLFRMTPEETLVGATRNAAKALGLGDRQGQLKAGMDANLAIWDVQHPAELSYRIGDNPLRQRIFMGNP